jgi:hypothetical protein
LPVVAILAGVLMRAGEAREAATILHKLGDGQAYGAPLAFAIYYLLCSQIDLAADWTEKAIEQRDAALTSYLQLPQLKGLRRSSRWPRAGEDDEPCRRVKPSSGGTAWTHVVEPDQINVSTFPVFGNLEQVDDIKESRFASQLGSDLLEIDELDRIHFDRTFVHRIPATHFDMRMHPYSDTAGDFAPANSLA